MVNNNCTKGGAYCTNTLGLFNCTCPTQYFWNGIECEGLFSVPLSCSMGMSFHGISLIKFLNQIRNSRLSCCLSGCLSLHFFVFLCVHMFVILHFLWNVGIGHLRVLGHCDLLPKLRREKEAKSEVALTGIRCWRVKNYLWERRIKLGAGGKVKKKKAELFNLSKKTDQTSRFFRTPRNKRETF